MDGRSVPFPRVIYDDVSRGATGHEKTPPQHEVGLRGWIDFLNVPFPGSLYRPYVTYRSDRLVVEGRGNRQSRAAGRETGRAIRRDDDGTKMDEGGKKDTTERE